ncbi:MAG TPA: hypothetical protein VMT21_00085 [Gemmatimonadales bacterium]|nr:hypothetical protein [Gemmatimonadales bacterium]
MQEAVAMPALWLPIVLSAVIVFVGSSIVWMVLKYENADWKPVPGEDQLREAVRKLNLAAPGQYVFPHMMGSSDPQAAMKKWEEGPNGLLLLIKPQKFSMGGRLTLAFIYYLVVSFFAAYVASHALARGTDYLRVFQIVGAASFMGYGLGVFTDAIWWGRTWSSAFKTALSALIYACLTAGTFGWLWPR